MKGRGEREIPEKTRQPVRHDSHMRKSGATRPGIEPGSPWWEASRLTAQPPWPLLVSVDDKIDCANERLDSVSGRTDSVENGISAMKKKHQKFLQQRSSSTTTSTAEKSEEAVHDETNAAALEESVRIRGVGVAQTAVGKECALASPVSLPRFLTLDTQLHSHLKPARDFEIVATLQRGYYLAAVLGGPALSILQSLPKRHRLEYLTLLSASELWSGDRYLRHVHHAHLRSCTQRPEEPLQELWQDIVRSTCILNRKANILNILNHCWYRGGTVAERLASSPPTKANRWESCRTMPLVGGFSRGSPVSPAPSFRRRSIFTSITLIGSQDLAIKSRPNLFTHSRSVSHAISWSVTKIHYLIDTANCHQTRCTVSGSCVGASQRGEAQKRGHRRKGKNGSERRKGTLLKTRELMRPDTCRPQYMMYAETREKYLGTAYCTEADCSFLATIGVRFPARNFDVVYKPRTVLLLPKVLSAFYTKTVDPGENNACATSPTRICRAPSSVRRGWEAGPRCPDNETEIIYETLMYTPFTVISKVSEALLKFYFQAIAAPHVKLNQV
ncbi:hypothetical protein PR048_022288 [Dryococelus australis]|uniref:Uncharacterized protein n=1 Tax=Dryococelus australis TaxID=614101 RepID=A0ABQ9H0K1_9NEOP|nr:hypothetical protein PR048_022288 [Dryococelus australis]